LQLQMCCNVLLVTCRLFLCVFVSRVLTFLAVELQFEQASAMLFERVSVVRDPDIPPDTFP